MNLNRYIQGTRKGRDINYLEREAMRDPFLADALEGYDRVKGEHQEQINAMKMQITQQTRSKNNQLLYWGGAAAILLIIAVGIYFLQNKLPNLYNNLYTKFIKIKPDTNSATIDTVSQEKTAVLQPDPILITNSPQIPDSLQKSDYRFKIQDTIPYFAAFPNDIAKSSADSLYDSLLIKEAVDKKTDENPLPPETTVKNAKPAVGYREYENYLKSQMIRPVESDCENVKGKVTLTFSINGNGRPYDISVLKSLCPSADAEAIRLLKEGPGWISGDTDAQVEVRF